MKLNRIEHGKGREARALLKIENHIGSYGVQGGDRTWTVAAYGDAAKNGWYGDGRNLKEKDHDRDYYINKRKDNGRP